MKQPICFAVETKARELDSRLLVGLHLASQGFPILIGSRNAVARECSFLHGAVYVGKSVDPTSIPFYRHVKGRGGKIALMDEEGGVYYGDGSEGVRSRIPEKVVPFIDFYLVFGEAIKGLMVKLLDGIQAERIHVTGNARFDLMRERFDPFFAPEVSPLVRTMGQYTLVNTNFALANGFKKGVDLIQWIERHENLTPNIKEVMKRHVLVQAGLHKKFIELVLFVADRFPKSSFVVRPHPSEDEIPYVSAFARRTNIFVKKEGNVASWIRGAEAVIHNDCTTAIESKIAGKFVVSYCPVKDTEMSVWLPVLASDVEATTPLEVAHHLDRVFGSASVRYELGTGKAPRIEEYIGNLRTEGFRNVVEAFRSELAAGVSADPWRLTTGEKFRRTIARLRSRYEALQIFINTRLRRKTNESADKYRGITQGELEKKLVALAQATDACARFEVRKFGHECFLITALNSENR